MLSGIDPVHVQVLAVILIGLGLTAVIARRNLFFVLMGLELMLNAINLSFIGFSRTLTLEQGSLTGQIVPLFVIAIAAAEACVALAMVITLIRSRDSLDADAYATMQE